MRREGPAREEGQARSTGCKYCAGEQHAGVARPYDCAARVGRRRRGRDDGREDGARRAVRVGAREDAERDTTKHAERGVIEDHSHKPSHPARKAAEQERARGADAIGGIITHLRLPHLFSRIPRASSRCNNSVARKPECPRRAQSGPRPKEVRPPSSRALRVGLGCPSRRERCGSVWQTIAAGPSRALRVGSGCPGAGNRVFLVSHSASCAR